MRSIRVARALILAASSMLLAVIPALVGAQQGRGAPAQRNASAAPSNVCITPQAQAEVTNCPAGAAQAAAGKGPGTNAPRSRLREAERRREKAKSTGPTGPSIELDAAARRNRERVEARAWDLLQREVQVLQRLVRNTRTNDPRRPDILLRLAETYFEMQQVMNARVRSFDNPIHEAGQAKNAAKMRQLRQRQQQAQAQLNRLREEAIRTYATLVQDHPNYQRMDEVLFSLAFGLEELRQQDRARQVYHRLIKGFPQSRFVPHAYLSFAEFYFNEGDMGAANQFYSKVTEFPPERNPVYGYALYKQAWATYNQEDFRASLQKFVEVIEFATQNPEARDATNLARQSRREMVLPYAQVGSPNRALEFFRRYTTNEEQAIETFESLGELYYDTGQWNNTIAVYQKLIAEQPRADKTCYWQTRVANAIISSRPKDEQVREIQRTVDLYEAFAAQGGHSQESVAMCKQESATMLISLATAWHREAIGTDTQPGTNDRSTMNLASQLYRVVLDKFPDMERMRFPDIDRRDWPTQYKVSYYYAELLWKMEEWAQCGPAFDRVVELDPSGEYTTDAALAAVLCYNNLYQQSYQSREREVRGEEQGERRRGRRGRRGRQQAQQEPEGAARFARRDFTALEEGMANAFRRYMCYVQDSEDLPTIKYRRARIYYEANRFEEAALLFKDIAWNHRDSELSVYAANLYLDSLNVMGSQMEPKRTQCIVEIKESIEPLFGFYCNTDETRETHQELCEVLAQLRCDVLRKEAEAYESNEQWQRAARTYVTIFRRFRECGRLDEVLYNAAINFEAARLLGRAIQVRKVLIERFPESEWAKRAVFLVGANYHALAIYSQAAEYYEQFARSYPGEDGSSCSDRDRETNTCAVAHEALQNAVFFRLGLGEEEKAIEDARLFERNYRRRLPRETSQVIFSLGTIYERQENWSKVIDHYRDFLRSYRRQALPQQVIKANVEIGKAYLKSRNQREQARARGAFQDALRAWQGGAANEIAQLPELDDQTRALYLYEAKDGASEALFYMAEYKYADFKQINFPQLRGARNMEAVNRWATNDFAPWIERKRTALVAAQTEYEKIAELQIPRWEIAAAARIGEMWRSFVDEFRDAPIPDEIREDPELFDIYVGTLDEQSQPFVVQAKEKFEFCLITATRVRWFNEWSQQCEQELNRLDPRQYPLAAELRGTPSFVHSSAALPSPARLSTADEAAEESTEVEGGGET